MTQTTNIRRILDRVMRHPMLRDISFESAIEYAVDFISLMGTPALYEEKTAIIPIHDWRGPLPCDFVEMIQVRVAGKNGHIPGPAYRYSGHSFHMSNNKVPDPVSGLTYKLQGMVIFTSTKETDVEIAYRAFAVDNEGYPLLPDNPSFLRGLETYIKLQWFTILYDMGKIDARTLQNAKQDYAWAAGDAQSEFSRLSLDQAETLFNSFKTLLPRNHEHWKGFFTNSSKEIWHNDSAAFPRITGVGGGSEINLIVNHITYEEGGDTPTPEPTPEPTPSGLTNPVYYGGQSTELLLDSSTGNVVKTWSSSKKYTISGVPCDKSWYYIAIPSGITIVSIITENTEPITDLFVLKGTFRMEGITYKLYQMHLQSGLALNVNSTLKVK